MKNQEKQNKTKEINDINKKQPEERTHTKIEEKRKIITIPSKISVKDLGNHMGVEPVKVIKAHGFWFNGKHKCRNRF